MATLSRTFALVLLALLLTAPALADTTWTVDYYLRGDISQVTHFYGPGAYQLLLTPNYVTVYTQTGGQWTFLGTYGAPFTFPTGATYADSSQWGRTLPQAVLPASFPTIAFPAGTDAAGVVPVTITVAPPSVSVPERAILPRLPKLLPRLFGWGVEATITHGLQRATTWLSAAILRAPHSATEIYLPALTVKVIEGCAGYQTLALLLLGAGLIAAVMPNRKSLFAVGLIFVAGIIFALEANALRVIGIALGLEHLGAMSQDAKDWIQIGTTGLALAQLAGLGRLVGRGSRPERAAVR